MAKEHHPSCRESDKDLVWHCSQCGLNEPAAEQEIIDELREACKFVLKYDGHKLGSIGEATLQAAIARAEGSAA